MGMPPEEATRMARRVTEALARSTLFGGLSQRDLRWIAKGTELYTFGDGRVIVEEGKPSEGFFVILDGTAKVTRGGRTIRRMHGGDFFGEIGLLDGGPRTATVVAEGPLTALVLLRKEFLSVLREEPNVAYRILRGSARRLRTAGSAPAG
jgi:CRP/FNR family transcriptional regulator, cyclic AMP receptor protein